MDGHVKIDGDDKFEINDFYRTALHLTKRCREHHTCIVRRIAPDF